MKQGKKGINEKIKEEKEKDPVVGRLNWKVGGDDGLGTFYVQVLVK